MKHLIPINEYFSNINEGINFNGSSDADLATVGEYFANDGDPDDFDEEALIDMAREALKKAKPIPLTGKIKEDGAKLIKYIVNAFKKVDVILEEGEAVVYSPNFANEIEIPVADQEGLFFQSYLDYEELAYNGSDFIISGTFATEDEGSLDFSVSDLSNNGQIVKAATELKKYLENTKK